MEEVRHFSLCVTCLSVAVHKVRFRQHCCIPHESIICAIFLHVTWFYLRIPKISNIQNFSPPPQRCVCSLLSLIFRTGPKFLPPPLLTWKLKIPQQNQIKSRRLQHFSHPFRTCPNFFASPHYILPLPPILVNNEAYLMVNQVTEHMTSELRGLMELIYQLLYS